MRLRLGIEGRGARRGSRGPWRRGRRGSVRRMRAASAAPSGRNTSTSSMRLSSSGRKKRRASASACASSSVEAAWSSQAKPGRSRTAACPRFEVSTNTAWRASAVRPCTSRHAALVEHLQEDVEDARVRLLDLVEQHHRVRPRPQVAHQQALLVVADVARRRAEQARDRVLLHVLRHVEPQERGAVAEKVLGQQPGELGLADARGPEQQEHRERPRPPRDRRVGEPDAPRHGVDGRLLPDQALAQEVSERGGARPRVGVRARRHQLDRQAARVGQHACDERGVDRGGGVAPRARAAAQLGHRAPARRHGPRGRSPCRAGGARCRSAPRARAPRRAPCRRSARRGAAPSAAAGRAGCRASPRRRAPAPRCGRSGARAAGVALDRGGGTPAASWRRSGAALRATEPA